MPEYNQETQYVVEKEPVDMGGYLFVGLEVREMTATNEPEIEHPVEQSIPYEPEPEPTTDEVLKDLIQVLVDKGVIF